jgi:hypothetical protein
LDRLKASATSGPDGECQSAFRRILPGGHCENTQEPVILAGERLFDELEDSEIVL